MAWNTRKETRVSLTIQIRVQINPAMRETIHLAKEKIEAQVVNLSVHGIGIVSRVFLPKGLVLDVELPRAPFAKTQKTAAEGSMQITGQVAYAKSEKNLCRMGIHFTSIEKKDLRFIERFLSSLERRVAPRLPL